MSNKEFPILNIELEGMRMGLKHALSVHATEINDLIQKKVDAFCTTENLERLIGDMAESHIKNAIESEVKSFYQFGPGRKAIREAVYKTLGEDG